MTNIKPINQTRKKWKFKKKDNIAYSGLGPDSTQVVQEGISDSTVIFDLLYLIWDGEKNELSWDIKSLAILVYSRIIIKLQEIPCPSSTQFLILSTLYKRLAF